MTFSEDFHGKKHRRHWAIDNRMSSSSQKRVIEEIALKEGLLNYIIETKDSTIAGEGYNGVFTDIKVKDVQNTLELVIKSATKDEHLRNNHDRNAFIRKTYKREIYMYEKVLPKFDEFAQAMHLDLFTHAKFYGKCCDEGDEFLVLENLKKSGYKLWCKSNPMDKHHTALVIKEYAKFHAISLAMRETNPETYRELCEELSGAIVDPNTKKFFMKSAGDQGIKVLEDHGVSTRKFRELVEEVDGFVSNADSHQDEGLSVIVHGDSWCNNFMFKYEDKENPSQPTKVCFVDWQVSEIGSPIRDLSYFLFICCGKDILLDHKHFLKSYTDAVASNLTKMSCDPLKVFPISLFEREWKKLSKYGIFVTTGLLKTLLAGMDEGEKDAIYSRRVVDIAEYVNVID